MLFLAGTAFAGTGNALDNTLRGNAVGNLLAGLGGADRLAGLDGADTLDGGSGADTLDGGPGDDVFLVDVPGDVVLERQDQGIDTVRAAVNHALAQNVEILLLVGSAYSGSGNDLPNLIVGTAGANRLAGEGGADTLQGGAGNDIYVVDALDLLLEEADGGHDLVLASASFSLTSLPHIEALRFTGDTKIIAFGNDSDNLLFGNAAANRLDGGFGDDTLGGAEGNDTLVGGEGDDSLAGGAGFDRMFGGAGNDIYQVNDAATVVEALNAGIDTVRATISFILPNNVEHLDLVGATASAGTGNGLDNTLRGNGLDNLLRGLAGADSIMAGNGNDTLEGGMGADTLFGDRGGDLFHYASAGDGGDLITDYVAAQDGIAVSAAGFGGGLAAGMDLVATGRFVATDTALATSPSGTGQFILETLTGRLWWDEDGAGGAAGRILLSFATPPLGFDGGEIAVIA
jgi:Ca2+-binding RTX toxin-like protein